MLEPAFYVQSVFFCLTDKPRTKALPALRRTPRVGEFKGSKLGTRQMIAMIICLTECNENSLERRADAYRSNRNKSILCNFFHVA